jgi:intracellular sulfur oxidation DsrE/DsrF family protein
MGLSLLLAIATCHAVAEPVTGPVIDDYGPVYYVPEEPLELPRDSLLRAVFDIAAAPDEPETANYRLETVARYLNMHARAGVELQQMPTVVVLHGRAARSALSPEAFEERYGEPHPDAGLLRELSRAGVQFYVCGQSATAFGFRRDELAPGVEMSLSALTALVRLQSDGFALIPWGIK